MKSAAFYTVFAAASSLAVTSIAQAACQNGGNNQQNFQQPAGFGQQSQFGQAPAGQFFPQAARPNQAPAAAAPQFAAAPAGPKARITVVSAGSPSAVVASKAPTSRITVVTATPKVETKVATVETPKVEAPKAELKEEPVVVAETKAPSEPKEELAAIEPALKDLVGDWSAVARRNDGELTTVELKLDDRGWAKLTVPGTDGKPSTVKVLQGRVD